MVDQFPGMPVINVLMAAPMDFMNLAVRQATETLNVFNATAQNLAAALAVPPALPLGFPTLPSGLPGMAQLQSLMPALPGAGITAPIGAAVRGFGEMAPFYKAPPRVII